MVTETETTDYLQEIRAQVCSRCVEKPPGGPPCAPLGKRCGVEMHLPHLIRSIHEIRSDSLVDYLNHDRSEICEKCPHFHGEICPCPMDYLVALIVEAVETVDKRRRSDSLVADPFTSAREPQRAELEAVELAFAQSRGTWCGCDWPTQFGPTSLDLNGWTSSQADARCLKSEDKIADWRGVTRWLAIVEQHAHDAEAEAAKAVDAARAGEWQLALDHGRRAWALEFATGRPLWRSGEPVWQKLYQLLEQVCRDAEQSAAKPYDLID